MSRRSVPPISPDDLRDHASADRVDRIWSRLEADLESNGLVDRPASELMTSTARRSSRPAPRAGWNGASTRTRAWAVFAAAAMFGGGLYVGRVAGTAEGDHSASVKSTRELALDVFASGSEARVFTLPNGATLALEPETTVEMAEVGDTGLTLRLLHGSASIDNTRVGSSAVSIVTGEARLTAPAGGGVALRRNEHDVDVAVSSGTVEVEGPDMAPMRLAAGARKHVPILRTAAVLDPVSPRRNEGPVPSNRNRMASVEPRSEHPASTPEVEDSAAAPQPSWLAQLNHNSDFEGALKLLEAQGDIGTTIDRAQSAYELGALSDLLAKNRPDLAARAALRAIERFPNDRGVSALAYRLGNYYSTTNSELSARYYKMAQESGILDETVECRSLRAADPCIEETTSRARSYLEKFPKGSCRDLAESLTEPDPQDPQKCEPTKSEPGKPKEGDKSSGAPAASTKPASSAQPGPQKTKDDAKSGDPAPPSPGASSRPADKSAPPSDKTSEKAPKP